MAQIQLSNLSFAYDGSIDTVFDKFSLSFDSRWKLGVIAHNGKGKTTLLRLLAGELKPTHGSIAIPGGISPLLYPPSLELGDTSAQGVMDKLAPDVENWRFQCEINLLGLHEEVLERPFSQLSPGERSKIQLAALFAREDAYVLMDEPGNHLDAEGRRQLAGYLSLKEGFLLVSHERTLLNAVTDHSLALLNSGPEVVAGPYSVWAVHRKNRESFERSENARLAKEIDILESSARQSGDWAKKAHRNSTKDDGSGVKMGLKEKNRAKAAKLEKKSKQTQRRKENAAEEKRKLLHDVEKKEAIHMQPLLHHSKRLIEAKGLSLRYGNRFLLRDADFQVNQGDRLCLKGENGAGKSTLLRLIAGETPPPDLIVEGDLYIAGRLHYSVLPQESRLPDQSLMAYAQERKLDTTFLLTLLRKMNFPREAFERKISGYSAGQKRKLLLAASLCEPAHLYLWDEPLNFLDISSREQVEDLILEARPTMVFVEHDEYFQNKINTSCLFF